MTVTGKCAGKFQQDPGGSRCARVLLREWWLLQSLLGLVTVDGFVG